MPTPSEHNRAEHLSVTYFWTQRQNGAWKWPVGWYVVRTCRCHYNKPVTLPFRSRERAEHCRELLLHASKVCGT